MAKILAVDYGDHRVGFAVSDALGIIAMPREVVTLAREDDIMPAILRVIRETGAERVVLGLPINMNGSHGPMAQKVAAFAARLRLETPVPVELLDERMTTKIAERTLLDFDVSRARRKKVIDKLAAQVLLQSYLDAHAVPDGDDEDAPL